MLAVLWVVFGVLHSVLAGLKVKAWFSARLGKGYRFYRIVYNLFFLGLLGLLLYLTLWRDESRLFIEPTGLTATLGYGLLLAGGLLMGVSFAGFDVSEFLGFAYLKPADPNKQIETLRTTGMYAWVRHPLYFATFVFVLGFFFAKPTELRLMTLLFIYIYTYIGARLEEKKLVQIFGEPYKAYQQKVKMLVPFVF